MTHSLPIPAAGWSPKHALTLTVTPSQALLICSLGNYGIRHLELWFIGIFPPPPQHAPFCSLSECPQVVSLSQAPWQGVPWSAGQHLGAQHLQAGQMHTHTAPHPSLSCYCVPQTLHTTVGLRDHGSALDGIDPWLGLGLQTSGGRHRAARLQSCFKDHESRLKHHKDAANREEMLSWLGCYPLHYAELFPRCLHSSCKRKKPKRPRYGGSISGGLEAACCTRNTSGDEARVTGWITHPSSSS